MTADPEELGRSLTGFEELAIHKAFGRVVDELTGTMTLRAMLFILRKREGTADKDAYQQVMSMPLGEVSEQFTIPGTADDDSGKEQGGSGDGLPPSSVSEVSSPQVTGLP